jgi:hypothetical protein
MLREGYTMEDIVVDTFHSWTKGQGELKKRISVFNRIRDIPYAIIPQMRNSLDGPRMLLKEMRGSCSPKHFLLGRMFQMLDLKVRYVTYPFLYSELGTGYPKELADLAARMPIEYHLACKCFIDGRWVLVDATWDPPLGKAGFPINETWDGKSDTLLAVKPMDVIEHNNAKGRDALVSDKKSTWRENEKALELEFIQKLNEWLEAVRKTK